MSIDILSLHVPEATLIHKNTEPAAYRVDAEKLKQDLQKARENGEIKDLYEASGKSQAEIDKIHSLGADGVRHICNYSMSVFFSREMPQIANADGSYTIGGVSFAEDELMRVREVMKTAVEGIGLGPGKNINVDYRNYAQMALAENAVNHYAGQTLNKEQQGVVAKAMKEYNAGLMELQDNLLSNGKFTGNNYGELSDYYGLSHVLSEEDAKQLNKMKAELSRLTGRKYQESEAGDVTGMTQIATNKTLTKQITDLFGSVDISDKEALGRAMRTYQDLMRPVYRASLMASPSRADEISAADTKSFMALTEKIMAGLSYKSVDYMI